MRNAHVMLHRCVGYGLRIAVLTAAWGAPAFAQAGADAAAGESPSPSAAPAATGVVATLQREAAKLEPLVRTKVADRFLSATKRLPEVQARTLYIQKGDEKVLSETEFSQLPAEEKGAFQPRKLEGQFYYYTAFGSPLVYVRPLDIAAAAQDWTTLEGKRVFDFGYGSIGQLRLMASCGAEAVGVDVQPYFRALYSDPTDTGRIPAADGKTGLLQVLHGQFPADPEIVQAAGTGYDLFTAKNVLKRGYIHPAQEVDPRDLVDLGVDDATFIQAVYDALAPGGCFLIYNLSPAQVSADQGYLPHADGRCPFDRSALESVGFEVLAYNKPDNEVAHDIWMALGYNNGKSREEMAADLFAQYTLCRKAVATGEPRENGTPSTDESPLE